MLLLWLFKECPPPPGLNDSSNTCCNPEKNITYCKISTLIYDKPSDLRRYYGAFGGGEGMYYFRDTHFVRLI